MGERGQRANTNARGINETADHSEVRNFALSATQCELRRRTPDGAPAPASDSSWSLMM